MQIPVFTKLDKNRLLYNEDGEFVFYVPENYFVDVKQNPIAVIYGQYVSLLGIIDWALVSTSGKVGEVHNFFFPSIFMCKPNNIEKVKNFKINNLAPRDYRILHFKKGDEIISDINTPNIVDNVETMFGMMAISGNKIPNTVPYDHAHEYFPEAMALNGDSFNMNIQFFGIMVSEMYRDPKDPSKPFRLSKMDDMHGYKKVSIKQIPNYISPYVAFTNENMDESIMAAILMDDESKYKRSPLEKVVTE